MIAWRHRIRCVRSLRSTFTSSRSTSQVTVWRIKQARYYSLQTMEAASRGNGINEIGPKVGQGMHQVRDPSHWSLENYKHQASMVYLLSDTDPFVNLAVEEWFFQHTPIHQHALLFYRNSPCIVVGRHQNPWKEVHLDKTRRYEIPVVRRRSGGGTVYQDLGNTNFSLIQPKDQMNRADTAQSMSHAIHTATNGVLPVSPNERGDLLLDGRKVSGSAYRITRERAYHHATMLLDADLAMLRECLGTQKTFKVCKGVSSVGHPVTNVVDYLRDQSTHPSPDSFDHNALIRIWSHAHHQRFLTNSHERKTEMDMEKSSSPFNRIGETVVQVPSLMTTSDIQWQPKDRHWIQEEIERLKDHGWIWGHTPAFQQTIDIPQVNLQVTLDVCRGALFTQSSRCSPLANDGNDNKRYNASVIDALSKYLKMLQGHPYTKQTVLDTFALWLETKATDNAEMVRDIISTVAYQVD